MLKKCITLGIILLFLGMSVLSICASSNENIKIYISAGQLFPQRERTFGLGYVIGVKNNNDFNITGICYINHITLTGKIFSCERMPIKIPPFWSIELSGIDFDRPLNLLFFTVEVENITVTKSAFEVGPFVLVKEMPVLANHHQNAPYKQ
jgi:hypothetical protein